MQCYWKIILFSFLKNILETCKDVSVQRCLSVLNTRDMLISINYHFIDDNLTFKYFQVGI